MKGDRSAFEILWSRHERLVHAILISMVTDQEAEDLMQDVALSAWRAIPRLERPERFSPWLSTIARNLGRTSMKRSVELLSLQEQQVDLIDPRARTSALLDADEVMVRIRELPESYRLPLTLRLVLELPAAEIAAKVGMTPGSVRVNLCRGMKLLRAALAPDEEGEPR